jgi:hypothetical protein
MVSFVTDKPGCYLLIQQLLSGKFNFFFDVVGIWHGIILPLTGRTHTHKWTWTVFGGFLAKIPGY